MTRSSWHVADEHPAILGDWWARGAGEGFLLVAAIFLAIGAAICGASVAGAEWKWGTVTTALTWEPRRVRLHLARTLSAGVLAFFIGLALQVIFFVAALPAVFAHGNTDGVDGAWWIVAGRRDGSHRVHDCARRGARAEHRDARSQHRRGPRRARRSG